MTRLEETALVLSTADPGFIMKNDKNGREVEVLDKDRFMYACRDHKKGIYCWTSSEEEAFRWLEGTLYSDLNFGNTKLELSREQRERIRRWRTQLANL